MNHKKPLLVMHVQEKYFHAIDAGRKLVEGRLGKEKYLALQPGDVIAFVTEKNHSPLKLICEVLRVIHYPSFKAMLESEGLSSTLPGESSVEEGAAIYREFYSAAEEASYGVAAIIIKKHQ